jgi:hypothetical protein
MRLAISKRLELIRPADDFADAGLDLRIDERIVQILRLVSRRIVHDGFRIPGTVRSSSSHGVPDPEQ